jgi:hypothetical protein
MDMTKFADDEDEGYLSVSTEIMRWVRATQKAPIKPGTPLATPQTENIDSLDAREREEPPRGATEVDGRTGNSANISFPYPHSPGTLQPRNEPHFTPEFYPQQLYPQQLSPYGAPQNSGYFPQAQAQPSLQPQQGSSTYNNYGGKQVAGNTIHGNITL